MPDPISRAEMLEALGHFNDYVNGDPHFLNGIETAKEIAENLPTIDAIPVEWLREKMKWADDEGDLDSVDIFSWILRTWQKEQEAQDG